jgi:hypothetical protein
MFLHSSKSLLSHSAIALNQISDGDIDSALKTMSEMRWRRALWSESSNFAEFTPWLESSAVSSEKSDQETNELIERILSRLDSWAAEMLASMDNEIASNTQLGIELLIENLLSKSWMYSCDIAVLTGELAVHIHSALKQRGQRKVIVFLDPSDIFFSSHYAYFSSQDDDDQLIKIGGSSSQIDEIAQLAGKLPRQLGLICPDPTKQVKDQYLELLALLQAVAIDANSKRIISPLLCDQYLSNLPLLAEWPSIRDCQRKFLNQDILVVSPGPSLSTDLDVLREHQDKFVIISALKATSALLNAGIRPDLAIWQDPRDHLAFIPKHPELFSVPILISECCHEKFLQGEFEQYYIFNHSHLTRVATANSLHGPELFNRSTKSVSTTACLISLELGCASVTLLGQDLSFGERKYISDGSDSDEILNDDQRYKFEIYCKSIDGILLKTQPNFLSFIKDFKELANRYSGVGLYNCTSRGAFLEGWDHLSLAERIARHKPTNHGRDRAPSFERLKASKGRLKEIKQSCLDLKSSLNNWLIESQVTIAMLKNGVRSSINIEELTSQEKELRALLKDDCSILALKCGGISDLIVHATYNCRTIEETFIVSLDYYEALDAAARKLILTCEEAIRNLEYKTI